MIFQRQQNYIMDSVEAKIFSPSTVKSVIESVSSTLLPPLAKDEEEGRRKEEEVEEEREEEMTKTIGGRRKKRNTCHELVINCLVVGVFVLILLIFFIRDLINNDQMYSYINLLWGKGKNCTRTEEINIL